MADPLQQRSDDDVEDLLQVSNQTLRNMQASSPIRSVAGTFAFSPSRSSTITSRQRTRGNRPSRFFKLENHEAILIKFERSASSEVILAILQRKFAPHLAEVTRLGITALNTHKYIFIALTSLRNITQLTINLSFCS